MGFVLAALLFAAGEAHGEEAGQSAPRHSGQDSSAVRSPTGAMLRSLLLPGWGQFYNGRGIKGSLIAAAEVGCAASILLNGRREPGEQNHRRLFVLSTIGILFYSAVDAYVDAHLDQVDWGAVEVDPEAREARVLFRVRW